MNDVVCIVSGVLAGLCMGIVYDLFRCERRRNSPGQRRLHDTTLIPSVFNEKLNERLNERLFAEFLIGRQKARLQSLGILDEQSNVKKT